MPFQPGAPALWSPWTLFGSVSFFQAVRFCRGALLDMKNSPAVVREGIACNALQAFRQGNVLKCWADGKSVLTDAADTFLQRNSAQADAARESFSPDACYTIGDAY